MVKNIQMDEATMAALRVLQSQAIERGVALGPYLQSLAEQTEKVADQLQNDVRQIEEKDDWNARLREWAERFPKSDVIADDSRESIYPDRI